MAAGSKRSSTGRSTAAPKRGRSAGKVTSRRTQTAAPRGRKPSTPTKVSTKASQKPVRGRATATGKPSSARNVRRTDVVLAAQLEAIASGLEQLTTLSAALEEMYVLMEALDRKMETLLAGNQDPGHSVTQPAPTVLDDGQTGERSDDTPASSWDSEAPASSWGSDASTSSWNREEETSDWDREEESSKAAD